MQKNSANVSWLRGADGYGVFSKKIIAFEEKELAAADGACPAKLP